MTSGEKMIWAAAFVNARHEGMSTAVSARQAWEVVTCLEKLKEDVKEETHAPAQMLREMLSDD